MGMVYLWYTSPIRHHLPLAQWIRAVDFYSTGREFESLTAGHTKLARRGKTMDFLLERKRTEDMLDEVISFRGEVRTSDLIRLRLSNFDRALLEDINGDARATPADYLLGLEMIFRRHAEQVPNARRQE